MTAMTARTRWTLLLGVLALGALIIVALWWMNRDLDEGPAAPTPSPVITKTSPAPSASPEAPEPTIIEGFAPVPHLPAESIPWDQVGPGWFAVSYFAGSQMPPMEESEKYKVPDAEGGVSLVDPAGTWYAARRLDDLGAGEPFFWDGDAMYMRTHITGDSFGSYVDVNVIDLASADVMGMDTDVLWERSAIGIGPGQVLIYSYGGDGVYNFAAGVDTVGLGACSNDEGPGYWGWEPEVMSFLYSPQDGGRLVCFGPARASGGTEVTLVNVSDPSRNEVIDTFRHDHSRYAFAGWLDADRFLFARTQEDSDGADQMFVYDLQTGSIETVDLPIYSDVEYLRHDVWFDLGSQRHIVVDSGGQGATIEFYTPEGDIVANLGSLCLDSGEESWLTRVVVSGERLFVVCAASGEAQMFDLRSGDRLGAWSLGDSHALLVHGHRPE
jgi:hypothetical protein